MLSVIYKVSLGFPHTKLFRCYLHGWSTFFFPFQRYQNFRALPTKYFRFLKIIIKMCFISETAHKTIKMYIREAFRDIRPQRVHSSAATILWDRGSHVPPRFGSGQNNRNHPSQGTYVYNRLLKPSAPSSSRISALFPRSISIDGGGSSVVSKVTREGPFRAG